ncbi:MAG: protoheme IX farnesyltransferase [Lentimicrobiaceae bacterium]|jgi:heme o synthase|nr:protoheme IX farnesyltransferase [Lentimicrobiaceae bacterium]MCP4910696.1 protoheme IX farnesyltransferase [Bacteroidota bacterium]MBT3454574.1 protoheme IX farnesyltransferase [Lentimicrobiaceae bacterium]MBT3818272.1 protoheme IX farnesyltransferase [Lentimicrobiaceae bacterium]MBT4062247.1 protoheme IX farnesyltransferase [Lentimicrobiaceae bacterium]
MRIKHWLKILVDLNKVRITFAVTLTTIAGYILAKDGIDLGIISPVIGIFILACGSAALNHIQDQDKDAIMKRTSNRPIPSGQISSNLAIIIGLLEVIVGSTILYFGSGFLALQLGLLALIWYNGIYTPLKRKTAFAVIPGSIIGALPPLVGWVAAGGSLMDPKAMVLGLFFFMWQIPHFWLLMLKYGEEYKEAGFPSITSKINTQQIKNSTFLWTVATAISALMVAMSGLINLIIFKLMILAAAIWLVVVFASLLKSKSEEFNPFYYFMRINYFVLIMILVLSIEPLIK